jgi:hypothetical protein
VVLTTTTTKGGRSDPHQLVWLKVCPDLRRWEPGVKPCSDSRTFCLEGGGGGAGRQRRLSDDHQQGDWRSLSRRRVCCDGAVVDRTVSHRVCVCGYQVSRTW